MLVMTMLANKGGAGRTAAVVMLGAAFLTQGLRVLVLDAGDEARSCKVGKPGLLEGWRDRVLASGVNDAVDAAGEPDDRTPLLTVVTVRDVGDLLAALDEAAAVAALGSPEAPDVVLIDTARGTDDRARVALRATDLVLAPFRNALDAHWVRQGLDRDLPPGLRFRGLPCGVRGGSQEEREARESFGYGFFLHRDLPDAPTLLMGLWEGWIAPYRGPRAEQGWDKLAAGQGRAVSRTAGRTWAMAMTTAQDALATARHAPSSRPGSPRQGLRLVRPRQSPAWLDA